MRATKERERETEREIEGMRDGTGRGAGVNNLLDMSVRCIRITVASFWLGQLFCFYYKPNGVT